MANLAICAKRIFRIPCGSRWRRCLTGSFNSSDNPLLPTSAMLIRQRYATCSNMNWQGDPACFATRLTTLIAACSATRRAVFLLRPTPASPISAFTCAFWVSARTRSSITAQELHLFSSHGIAGDLDARLGLLDPGQPLRYLKSIFGPPTASLRMLLAQFATIATSTPQTRHLANAPCDEACLLAADALRQRESLRA